MENKLLKLSNTLLRSNQLKLLSIAKEKKGVFLDLGCSNGQFSLEFATKVGAKEIYGVDINELALAEAQKKGITVVKADLNNKIPLPSSFFDIILSNQTMEHLINPDNLLEEIHRLLKPDGYLYISVPNLCSLHNRLFILLGWQPTCISPSRKHLLKIPVFGYVGGGREHLTAFSPLAFKQMLNLYGFRIIEYYGSSFYPFRGGLGEFLSRFFPNLSVFQIAVAIKCQKENIMKNDGYRTTNKR